MARDVLTASPEETEALGARLGRTAEAGALVGLVGDLGAGKTCLVRGLAAGLGADPTLVHSPTFVMQTEYGGGRLRLHHVDLYRLERPLDDELSFREVLYGDGVAAVEWFDRLLPAAEGVPAQSAGSESSVPAQSADEMLIVRFAFGDGSDRRTIRLEARGARHERWLARALAD
jgi:tRNA threonylcarbamoyladenosine biosynthesis protein TsaE